MIRTAAVLFCAGFLFFGLAAKAEAATRYANSSCTNNGDGTALTCAAGAGQPGAYNTFTAGYNGSSNNDTLELSGGTSGQSYAGHTAALAKILTIKGSTVAGHSGMVTITNNYASYTVATNIDGMVLQDLTISGGGTTIPLSIRKITTVTRVTLTAAGAASADLSTPANAGVSTITDLTIDESAGNASMGIDVSSGVTLNVTRFRIKGDGITSKAIYRGWRRRDIQLWYYRKCRSGRIYGYGNLYGDF